MASTITKSEIPVNPVARRAWVVYRLKLIGESVASTARKAGLTQQAMSASLNAPSRPCEIALADALGVNVQDLFPDRYSTSGRRIVQTRRSKPSSPPAPRNVEKRGAV